MDRETQRDAVTAAAIAAGFDSVTKSVEALTEKQTQINGKAARALELIAGQQAEIDGLCRDRDRMDRDWLTVRESGADLRLLRRDVQSLSETCAALTDRVAKLPVGLTATSLRDRALWIGLAFFALRYSIEFIRWVNTGLQGPMP